MSSLDRREQQIWNFIAERLRLGSAPTVREIAVHCALRSTNAVHRHLKKMANKGYLKREPRTSRGLQVVDPAVPAPKATINIPVHTSIPSGCSDGSSPTPEHFLTLDLETLGVSRNAEVFALRARGDSMEGAGILDGDWIIIDSAKEPRAGSVVAAFLEGRSVLKRFVVRQGKPFLKSENPRYPELIPGETSSVQGVMIGLYRKA